MTISIINTRGLPIICIAATMSACTPTSGDHVQSRTEGSINTNQLAAISHGPALDASINCNGKTGTSAPDFMVPTDYASIQDAIDASSDGDTICVEAGTYYENIDFDGKAVSVIGAAGAHRTILDGGGSGTVVTMENGEDSDTVLRGFTITNGYAVDGAGMYFYDVAPTLRNLIIADNEATDDGAGVFSMYSQYTMDNVLFHENVAGSWGGGIYGYIDTGSMNNVAFVSNSAGSGGGLVLSWGGMDITNAKIIGNSATYSGGGIYVDWDSNDIINGVITGNSANKGGGIYAGEAARIELINSTLSDNYAASSGSGAYLDYSYAHLYQDNSNMVNDDCVNGWYYCPTFTHEEDPGFVDTSDSDPLNWNLHLDSTSALIDAGDSTLSDPDGSTSDIGAYGGEGAKEWNLDDDNFFEWWQVGDYDSAYVQLDCDDINPTVNPNSGC